MLDQWNQTPSGAPNGDFFYFYDGSGSVSQVAEAGGTVWMDYAYDAWGNQTYAAGNGVGWGVFGYSTKEMGAPGMLFYGERVYRPDLARWMSRDPLGEAGGVNLYGFVGNNPVNGVDEYGLWAVFDRNTWFDGKGYQGSGLQWDAGSRAHLGGDLKRGFYAGVDGFNPAGNYYQDNGYYSECDLGVSGSRAWGEISFGAASSAIPSAPFVTAANKAVFWSGTGEVAAMNYARAVVGGKTLEMTAGGRIAGRVNAVLENRLSWEWRKRLIWKPASALFTLNSKGPVTALSAVGKSPTATSIWNTVEKPLLNRAGRSINPVQLLHP